MSEKKDFGEILTLQETAEFLQLSRATVYSYALLCTKGEIARRENGE